MNELRLPEPIVQRIVDHCLASRPNEACGVLAAHDGEVVEVYEMRNAAGSPVRYALDPAEQLRVYRDIEQHGWELGGVFHSHTRTEAYPSPTDVRLASEDVPYLIVSLAGEPPELRAFRIIKEFWTDDHGEIVELPVVVD